MRSSCPSNASSYLHASAPLLEAVDSRARHLAISRSRLVVRGLARRAKQGSEASPEFFFALLGGLLRVNVTLARRRDERAARQA